MLCLLLFLVGGSLVLAAPDPGKKELVRSCYSCHDLQIIEGQHLSREEWAVELRKMEKIGAKIRNRQLLLDYLAKQYGERRASR